MIDLNEYSDGDDIEVEPFDDNDRNHQATTQADRQKRDTLKNYLQHHGRLN